MRLNLSLLLIIPSRPDFGVRPELHIPYAAELIWTGTGMFSGEVSWYYSYVIINVIIILTVCLTRRFCSLHLALFVSTSRKISTAVDHLSSVIFLLISVNYFWCQVHLFVFMVASQSNTMNTLCQTQLHSLNVIKKMHRSVWIINRIKSLL